MPTNPQVNLANRKIAFPHQILGDLQVNVTEVGEWNEKSFDVKGTIFLVRDQEMVSIEAEAYKSGPEYKVLSSQTPGYARGTETTLELNGESFAYILLSAVEKIIKLDLQAAGYQYVENDGVAMDLDIQDNLAIVP